ncbi:hypothetical protein DR950_31730 [Kitasatospora xanthocidica]|uniref:Uncharacterized protein n=1 Tax=Kitasatospora xanthocidica TaxID=83382 RepID=A0A373A0M1_9ACTN|nr:hypothetical protein DR950_31730 [Kitasatospora xanthocidica]
MRTRVRCSSDAQSAIRSRATIDSTAAIPSPSHRTDAASAESTGTEVASAAALLTTATSSGAGGAPSASATPVRWIASRSRLAPSSSASSQLGATVVQPLSTLHRPRSSGSASRSTRTSLPRSASVPAKAKHSRASSNRKSVLARWRPSRRPSSSLMSTTLSG